MRCDMYLANAERILQGSVSPSDESAYRAAAHAAYYAVVHLVCQKLNVNITGPNALKHADVRRLMVAYAGPDSALQEARIHFNSLQNSRVIADYQLNKSVAIAEARLCVQRANAIFKAAGIIPSLL